MPAEDGELFFLLFTLHLRLIGIDLSGINSCGVRWTIVRAGDGHWVLNIGPARHAALWSVSMGDWERSDIARCASDVP